jgi:hypothetical protein
VCSSTRFIQYLQVCLRGHRDGIVPGIKTDYKIHDKCKPFTRTISSFSFQA